MFMAFTSIVIFFAYIAENGLSQPCGPFVGAMQPVSGFTLGLSGRADNPTLCSNF
jgi:hypothetical protein